MSNKYYQMRKNMMAKQIIKETVVNEIIDMYPHLQKDKNIIMNKIVGDKITEIEKKDNYELILDKFLYYDKYYYRDKYGGILDNKAKLIGTYQRLGLNEFKYYFFKYEI